MLDLAIVVCRKMPIPIYVKRFVDNSVDLNENKWLCCILPDHDEKTPSWKYKPETETWSCYGKCHTGGDTVTLHQKMNRFRTYNEALADLAGILGIEVERFMDVRDDMTNWDAVELKTLMAKIERKCKTPKQFCEFDNVMSFNEGQDRRMRRLEQFYASLI